MLRLECTTRILRKLFVSGATQTLQAMCLFTSYTATKTSSTLMVSVSLSSLVVHRTYLIMLGRLMYLRHSWALGLQLQSVAIQKAQTLIQSYTNKMLSGNSETLLCNDKRLATRYTSHSLLVFRCTSKVLITFYQWVTPLLVQVQATHWQVKLMPE